MLKEIKPALKEADKEALTDRIAVFKRTGLLNAHAVKETQIKADKVYKNIVANEKSKHLSVEAWTNKERQIAFTAAENKNVSEQEQF